MKLTKHNIPDKRFAVLPRTIRKAMRFDETQWETIKTAMVTRGLSFSKLMRNALNNYIGDK